MAIRATTNGASHAAKTRYRRRNEGRPDEVGEQEAPRRRTAPAGWRRRATPTSSAPKTMRPAAEQGEPGHRDAEGDDEGVLAVGLIHAEHGDEHPCGPHVVGAPRAAVVEEEEERQQARGERHQDGSGDVLRHPVVEEPVRDGAVATAVPEAVPEDALALAQQEHLVHVSGVVPPWKTVPVHQPAHDTHARHRDERHREQPPRPFEPRLEGGERHDPVKAPRLRAGPPARRPGRRRTARRRPRGAHRLDEGAGSSRGRAGRLG